MRFARHPGKLIRDYVVSVAKGASQDFRTYVRGTPIDTLGLLHQIRFPEEKQEKVKLLQDFNIVLSVIMRGGILWPDWILVVTTPGSIVYRWVKKTTSIAQEKSVFFLSIVHYQEINIVHYQEIKNVFLPFLNFQSQAWKPRVSIWLGARKWMPKLARTARLIPEVDQDSRPALLVSLIFPPPLVTLSIISIKYKNVKLTDRNHNLINWT